jgi:hypothetical protein
MVLVVVPALLLGMAEIRRVWRPREELKSVASAPITG